MAAGGLYAVPLSFAASPEEAVVVPIFMLFPGQILLLSKMKLNFKIELNYCHYPQSK